MSGEDLSVQLGDLRLSNPLLTASGTFGYGLEFAELGTLDSLGGIVTKGLSLEPMPGNPAPRICETRGGVLNSIGLQNIGVEAFLADVLPGLERYPAQVIVNLFGTSIDAYCRLAERVEPVDQIAAMELNVSCSYDAHSRANGHWMALSRGSQEAQSINDSVCIFAFNAKIFRELRTDSNKHTVESFTSQIIEREVLPCGLAISDLNTEFNEDRHVLIDLVLGQTICRDGAADHSASVRVSFEDR